MEGKLRAQLRSWLVRKMENEDDSVRRNRFGPGSGSFSAGGGSFEDDDDEDTDDGGGFFKTQF